MSCIFCRIVKKEIGNIIYENSLFVVIMDINPLSRGHMLVIPKVHGETLEDIPDEYLAGALVLVKKIVSHIGTITRYNILQNNRHLQSVPHVHFHIIPCDEEGEGLKVTWTPTEIAQEEQQLLAESYKNILRTLG